MNTNLIPNIGLARSWNADIAGRHRCDAELCTRIATHHMNPKAFGTFEPFRKGQRGVAGPMVCEIDAILIECDYRAYSEPDDKTPNSDPNAPRWEDTITLKRGVR